MFQFKQFTIRQDRCAMKVGTDGILLGCCVSITGQEKKAVDIGTGTGLLALMLAQRLSEHNHDFHIEGIEIDADAAQQASENFEASPWASHLKVHACPLAEYNPTSSASGEGKETGNVEKFDLIISNPPFYNATLKPDNEARAVARHKDSLPLSQIMDFANRHLTPSGKLSLIYPTEYDTEVMSEALYAQLRPQRIVRIFTKAGKPCKRLVTEFVRLGSPAQALQTEELYLRDADSQYSRSYREMTDPFYLHLK